MFLHLLLSRALSSPSVEKVCVAARLVRLPPFLPVGRVNFLPVRFLSPLWPLQVWLQVTGPLFHIIILILSPVPLFFAVFLKSYPRLSGSAVGSVLTLLRAMIGTAFSFLLQRASASCCLRKLFTSATLALCSLHLLGLWCCTPLLLGFPCSAVNLVYSAWSSPSSLSTFLISALTDPLCSVTPWFSLLSLP